VRDLDKELSSIKKQAALVMGIGWVLGIVGCGMLLDIGGMLIGLGFPLMCLGWFIGKKTIEVQVLK